MSNAQTPKKLIYPEHWRPSSLRDVLSRTPGSPPWVIDELLPAQSGILCSGLPHSGKSLNWLAAGLESVVTHRVWGRFGASKVNRFLFIETEDPKWLVEGRIHGLARGLGLKPEDDLERYGFFFSCTGPFELEKREKELSALIDDVRPDWVVLSTLQGLLGGRDWKEQKDMGPVNAIMVRLMRKAPLVVITHSPRNEKARRAAGSITQDANYLVTMNFQKKVNKTGNTTTSVIGDSKMGTELTFNLTLETESVTGEDGKTRNEVRRVTHGAHTLTCKEQIVAYRKESPKASVPEIAEEVGCSQRHVRNVLKLKDPKPVVDGLFDEDKDPSLREKRRKRKTAVQ
jgi:hypothetical protein